MATVKKIEEIVSNYKKEESYEVGFKQLDRLLGGIKEGSIVTIGARPAMGKTIFLNNIVVHLLEKYNLPTLYISLETLQNTLLLKLASVVTKEDYRVLQKENEKAKESIEKLQEKKYALSISDDCYSVFDLEQILEENKQFKFVVIDYIQLMKNEKTFSSMTDQYNDLLDRIKALAKTYKLVIFLVSQVSRSAECRGNARPLLTDLRQSGNLETNSDVVIFLYRDSYYQQDRKNTPIELLVAKNRNGSIGMTYLDYDEQKSIFIDY